MSVPCISLAMIVRDEKDNLDQCLRSVEKHVDQIVVVDTGSIDSTREVAKSHGAEIYQFDIHNHPEAFFIDDEKTCKEFQAPGAYSGDIALGDFGAARNESFRHATGDFVLWLDADDVLEGAENLRKVAADLQSRRLDFAFLPYDYARDHLGRVFYRQWRERLIRRDAANWVNPVHEVLMPKGQVTSARYDGVTVSHRRKADRKSIPHRNYKLLLRHVWEQAKKGADLSKDVDPRTLFYLGQEARFVEPSRAVGFYEDYLKRSGWAEERAAAHMAIGSLCEFGMLGQKPEDAYAQADREYAAAAVELPENPDGVFGLARIAYLRGRWVDCVAYSDRGFKVGNPESMLGANPMDRLYRPHIYYNHALANLGRIEEAIASCKAGIAIAPDDPGVPGGAPGMLKHNLAIYEAKLKEAQQPKPAQGPVVTFDKNEDVTKPPEANIPPDALIIWAMQLWKQNVAANDAAKARAVLDGIPKSVEADPVVARMREYQERRFSYYHGHAKVTNRSTGEELKAWSAHSTSVPIEVSRIERGEQRTGTEPGKGIQRAEGMAAAIRIPERRQNASLPLGFDSSGSPLSIVFWIGPAIEPWDPRTPNTTGIGGSETAAIEMAKNLRAIGHQVTVYGCCPQTEGIYDGVRYVHWQNCTGIDCDVLIASRAPQIMENPQHIRARLRLLWVHDIHVGQPSAALERWLLRFDRFLCLSQWHKQFFLSCYPTVHSDRVIVTRNGIDIRRFNGQATPEHVECYRELNPGSTLNPFPRANRLIFSSSPNRGLDMLLANFPFIRAQVPDAELHVYYGFETWEKFAIPRNDPNELADIARYKKALDDAIKNGGVHWHGRVNQQVLAEAFMRSKVWGYPTSFSETSCITAMEAQAAGCVPVCTRLAALPETVKHGILLDGGPNYGNQFVAECVRLLKDDAYRESFARPGREHALANLSWAALAKDWAAMFGRVMGEIEANPVPMWRSA